MSVRDLGLAPRKAFGAQKSRQFVLFSVKWAPTVGTVGTKTPTVGTNRKQIRRWVKTSSDLIQPIIGLLWDILSSLNLVFVALTLIWSYMFIDGKYNNPSPSFLNPPIQARDPPVTPKSPHPAAYRRSWNKRELLPSSASIILELSPSLPLL